nr:hypothetical protein [Pandoravirus massiliensis]
MSSHGRFSDAATGSSMAGNIAYPGRRSQWLQQKTEDWRTTTRVLKKPTNGALWFRVFLLRAARTSNNNKKRDTLTIKKAPRGAPTTGQPVRCPFSCLSRNSALVLIVYTMPVASSRSFGGAQRGAAVMFFAALLLAVAAVVPVHGDIVAARLADNPMVEGDMMQPACDGAYDSNFPTIIHAPQWLRPRLGNYYMYFSDHHGMFINMAYADHVGGPWLVYAPGTLDLQQVYVANNQTYNLRNLSSSTEVASPDVYVDEANRRIGMYFHARLPYNGYTSLTGIAFSSDGLRFDTRPGFFALPYTRRFTWRGDRNRVYLLDRRGNLLRSRDGYTNIEMGNSAVGDAFTNASMVNGNGYTGLLRHLGVSVVEDTLYVFGTRVGDAPERIVWTSMDLKCLRRNWTACATDGLAEEGFRPEYDYEGANLPNVPSNKGSANGPVNQLRDPFVFAAEDKCYMFYAAAGETSIAAARIDDRFCYARRGPCSAP